MNKITLKEIIVISLLFLLVLWVIYSLSVSVSNNYKQRTECNIKWWTFIWRDSICIDKKNIIPLSN